MAADIVGLATSENPKQNLQSDPLKLDQFFGHCVVQEAASFLEVFQHVLDAVDTQHPEVLKPPVLKNLYHHLVYWSLYCSSSEDSNYLDIRNLKFGHNEKFNGIHNMCNFLFSELSCRFERLYSALFFVPEDMTNLPSDMWGPQPEFTLLLRCCIVLLLLLEFDQSLLMEKCEILLSILGKLCSPDLTFHISRHMREMGERIMKFRRLVSYECTYARDGCVTTVMQESDAIVYSAEKSGSPMPLLCSILEVFMDELLVHKRLRQYFVASDAISCSKEKLFMCQLNFAYGDANAVIEVISAHFLLLVSDEQAFLKFLNKLSWWHGEGYLTAEVRLVAAMNLLGDPIMFSAPQIFQAYGISLISRCITDCGMASDCERFNCKLINCHLSAFERAFSLYTRNISTLQLEDYPLGAKSGSTSCHKPCMSGRGFFPSFESCIRPVTYDNIRLEVTKFSDNEHSLSPEMKSGLLNSFTTDAKENEFILDKSHRDEFLLILNCIITRTVSGEIEGFVLQRSGDISQQEMYLLASIIELMGNSLLKTICCMQRGNSGCLKTLKDYSLSREYDFLIGIIGCFPQITISRPTQEPCPEAARFNQTNHKESSMMLMHFAGLLRYSFDKGHEYLWKACIFMIMSLMNLIIFEESSLDTLKPLLGLRNESLPSQTSKKGLEALVKRNSSLIIASKFQKIQILTIRNQQETSQNILLLKNVEENVLSTEEDSTCNGEAFINLLQKCKKSPPDFDDLVDFVVCKQGKDYSSWLKDRERYRKWKNHKRASSRRKRSLEFWRSLHN